MEQQLLNSDQNADDLDTVLKYNRNMQENIANNMILMTRSMREHATIASGIIRRDIRSLENSNKLTTVHEKSLKSESLKLEEHNKSNWRCWVWLMVAFVLIVFFSKFMVIEPCLRDGCPTSNCFRSTHSDCRKKTIDLTFQKLNFLNMVKRVYEGFQTIILLSYLNIQYKKCKR